MRRDFKGAASLLVACSALFASAAAFAFPEPYCVRGYSNEVEPITSVVIDGISNASPATVNFTGVDGDQDFTAIVGALAPGGAYPISVKANTDGAYTDAIAVYIDWNHNGTFDSGEGYVVGTIASSTGLDGISASTSITVPTTATLGQTRMRVTHQNASITGTLADAPACGTTGYGQAEDYTVNIDPAAPVPPSLSAAFAPTNAPAPASTTLTLTLGNTSTAPAVLTADFTDTLPTGLVVATPSNASSTCTGTLTATAGSSAITLGNGGSIPVGGCSISATVSAAAGGIFVNSIPAGALTTSQGSGNAASATFQATQAGVHAYSTGFEAPFTVGALNSQQGWSARSVNVAAAAPANGVQHLSLTATASPSSSNYALGISPVFARGTSTYSAISANIRLSHTTNGANWRFNPQDNTAGLIVSLIQFERSATQKIQVGNLSGTSIVLTDTGATYPADTYFNIKAIINKATGELTVCKDGASIFHDTTGAYTAGRTIDNLAISQLSGSGNTAGNTYYIDDLVVDDTNAGTCDGILPPHTVTPSVGTPSGSIAPATAQTVADGATTSFTLTADAGFHVDTITGTCGGTLAGSVFTTAPVVTDCTVVANFAVDAAVTHTVTPSVGAGTGTITPSTPQTVNDGQTTNFTLAAATGFHVDTVTGTCGGSLAANVYTTAAVTTDCTVIANFAADSSGGDLVCPAAVNHTVAANGDGTYINWITGQISDTGSFSGYQFNPYGTSSLSYYWGSNTKNAGVATATTGTTWRVLQAGDSVGPTSIFSRGTGTATNWVGGSHDGYLGFSMDCSTLAAPPASGTCYGYAHLNAVGISGIPTTIVDYCYDKVGNAVTIPTTGGGTTYTVTPSVGTPSGAIAPATPQTVNAGATTSFALTPDTGFHVDTVGGTCSGSLVGNTYTTASVTADCTVIANFASNAGGTNGIIVSGSLNHVIAMTSDGTSLNIVTSALDDTGPLTSAWDFNFWLSGGVLKLYQFGTDGGQYAVDGSGNALLLQAGDVIGSASTFTTDAATTVPLAQAWLAGANGFLGVKFHCDGRLTNPVASTYCYGYVHLTTAAGTGFPASIVDTAFDGDGNAITIPTAGGGTTHTVTPSVGTPSGTIAPSTPQTVNDGATTTFTLTADAGFHVDNVGGTCGGTLAGSVYTTAAVTTDCSVIANFGADGGGTTHTVTPSVGTPSGTIAPDAAQTVNDGDTVDFTLTPATGFHIDNVGGTCGGTLVGDVYTTDPVTADCTVVANFAADGGGGLVCSGPINHAIASDLDGSYFGWESGFVGDDTPGTGLYNFNPYGSSGNLAFYWGGATAGNAGVAATATGTDWLVLQQGAVIGPDSTFSPATGAATNWDAGADGYLGFAYPCATTGTCYGYTHMTTTATTGFPATLVDYCYDPSGAAVTIGAGPPPGNDPSATVTPTSLSFTVDEGAIATQTLNIANAVGSDALTYAIAAQASRPTLKPHVRSANFVAKMKAGHSNADLEAKLLAIGQRAANTLASSGARVSGRAATPWVPNGSLVFELDDGTPELFFGLGVQTPPTEAGAVFINRFSATDALTVDSISIYWGDATDTGSSMQGLQANLVVYYDADADGDVSNAVRVGVDDLVTITILGDFQTYTTNFSIPAAGDVYIGFVDHWALAGGYTPRIFPGAIDNSSGSQGMSYLSGAGTPPTDINNLANNDLTGVIDDLSASLAGNLLIRATGTGGGGGGACTGPVITWLSANPATGSVNGGANTDVMITANPAAGGLAAGAYTGELCITTNDPDQPLIAIPVSLTVNAVVIPPSGCRTDDTIFCDGFDGDTGGGSGDVVTGDIDQPVVADGDGSSLDFALGDFHGYDAGISSDDINLYTLDGTSIAVYWYGDAVPAEYTDLVGGVVGTAGGVDFQVLHSGDTIGPDSPVSATSQGADMSAFDVGVDGYIGVAFYNEGNGTLNFGYLHVTTNPGGFPVQALDYGYDPTGAAVTIP